MNKVIRDAQPKMGQILSEVMQMCDSVKKIYEALTPYTPSMKIPVRKYIQNISIVLQQERVKNFSKFPALAESIVNGENTTSASKRIHNAIFLYRGMQQKISECNCLLKNTNEIGEMREQARVIISDLAAYVILEYNLWTDDGTVYMCVSEFCNREGITEDVLYGEMLAIMEYANSSFYIYEEPSKYNNILSSLYPAFIQECEEEKIDVDDDIAEELVAGSITVEEAKSIIVSRGKVSKSSEEEIDMPLSKLVTMSLN